LADGPFAVVNADIYTDYPLDRASRAALRVRWAKLVLVQTRRTTRR
jgi:hypothetical protein